MNIKLGRTLNLDSKNLRGVMDFDKDLEMKFFGVRLNINSKPEIYNFDCVESLFQFGENKDNLYCYLQYDENHVFILEKDRNQNFIGEKNVYNINNEWNLFLNSKKNIVVQQNKSPIITSYFRNFSQNEYFFVSLSYLYYCLRNYSFNSKIDLETKFKSLINW